MAKEERKIYLGEGKPLNLGFFYDLFRFYFP